MCLAKRFQTIEGTGCNSSFPESMGGLALSTGCQISYSCKWQCFTDVFVKVVELF